MKDDTFAPQENIHAEPEKYFKISTDLYIANHDQIVGMVHSHCVEAKDLIGSKRMHNSIEPSAKDMETQMTMGIPCGISVVVDGSTSDPMWWGDSLPIRPMLGRNFIHGINDCYSLVRDWHRLQGITFEDSPRDPDWWPEGSRKGTGDNFYEEGFEAHGFIRIQDRPPKMGDCFLCSLNSTKLNHSGVFVSNDQILHHAGGSLSQRSIAHRWRQKLNFIVRHKDLPEDGPYAPYI